MLGCLKLPSSQWTWPVLFPFQVCPVLTDRVLFLPHHPNRKQKRVHAPSLVSQENSGLLIRTHPNVLPFPGNTGKLCSRMNGRHGCRSSLTEPWLCIISFRQQSTQHPDHPPILHHHRGVCVGGGGCSAASILSTLAMTPTFSIPGKW